MPRCSLARNHSESPFPRRGESRDAFWSSAAPELARYERSGYARFRSRRAGFTLIEILVVLAIVALLLTISLPRYFQSIDVAKERVLVENLRTTRDAIDKYFSDTGRYPESLEELTERKYLRQPPFDPIVESSARWTIVAPSGELKGNVYDLKSSAEGTARNGKPFAEL
jgi:general secretion pathway protein G